MDFEGQHNHNLIIMDDSYSQSRRKPMTICIAAIASESKNECIVLATDHMVTIDIGERVLGKFEHTIKKYRTIKPNCIAMIAGNPVLLNDLLKDTGDIGEYDKIKDKIFENFKNKRDETIQNEMLDIYGVDKGFLKDLLLTKDLNPVSEEILKVLLDFNLGTSILLVGFNNDGLGVISEINENRVTDITDLHFSAIGSGQIQAVNTLYFQSHTKEMDVLTAVYNVFKAKSNAEVHEGVGKETDLLILRAKSCSKLTKSQLEILKQIYNEELAFGAKHKDLKKLRLKTGCELCY